MLIAKRVLLNKLHIMSKGKITKIRGTICNVPIDRTDISNTLPCESDSNGLVIATLKCKFDYRGHVINGNHYVIYQLLHYLKIK